jgi:predicted HAD superfamily Cof-like phosphohydrolase
MMYEQLCVNHFHNTFGITVAAEPQLPTEKDCELRVRLIQEELDELKEAFANKDLVEIADALGDILYVTLGAAETCGIDLEPIFMEVHRSNMSKVGGYKREDGKWVKPATYSPACIAPILDAQSKTNKEIRHG